MFALGKFQPLHGAADGMVDAGDGAGRPALGRLDPFRQGVEGAGDPADLIRRMAGRLDAGRNVVAVAWLLQHPGPRRGRFEPGQRRVIAARQVIEDQLVDPLA